MKINLVKILILMFLPMFGFSQKDSSKMMMGAVTKRELPAETVQTLAKTVVIKGTKVPYNVSFGTLPVYDNDNKVVASMFYTYYERSDVADKSTRPLMISFNGGPGTASVWMHIGYTGPRILNINDEGYPIQPYGMKDNPNSVLDMTDIVFVDPVNTGFSRILGKDVPTSKFFGVNADVSYLADWIDGFVSKYKRWGSPKFLIGESYGTTRVSGLAHELQSRHWMYLNGVILVSPTDLGISREGPVDEALMLPYYAATAWYHKALTPELQAKDLNELLPEVEKFTLNDYIPNLVKGHLLNQTEKDALAQKISKFSGLKSSAILQQNLRIPAQFFWKELLRDQGFTVGRLDSRYLGEDKKNAGDAPDYNAELTSWLHAFTPAINMYLRDELGFKTDLPYLMFGPVHPWDNKNNNTGSNLASAMLQNPFLHLLVQSGYYDGACDYFNAKYNLWQMDLSGKLKDRMDWKGYRSGHMMYLRKVDLNTSNEDLRVFIKKALPQPNEPADVKK
ncbi:MAG: carboxypeptidase [Alphaproteobacteria bacterium]|nr:carboxypeptidase [Alphaproteobacteria bacterium]